ncbi:hypothetical protein P3X46_034748 [Hevea brasiliensis]|uniref:Carrier domain-containing protein n=1 Tax=Hevea brasiliensis TaxID=3981 RepID=A0ABQ9KCK7_HEVBR|nr:putative acyl-activating enzyme 19 isoform X1 [Hevea brasiliensis]XP_057998429.1 putative acyl-activating enzyme 19 isoform X1 [Hevea brasiliensis]KAJ9131836.1 hypothetical protein P3X46_034748 [Hevea brasiliensis]
MSSGSSGSVEQLNQQEQHCCISHEFLRAATRNPRKIAAIHAAPSVDGQRQIAGELINPGSSVSSVSSSSFSSLVYEGDKCFTYGDLLKSVDFLSSRLRVVLDGADASRLYKTQSSSGKGNYGGQGACDVSKSSTSFIPRVEQVDKCKNVYRPKILGIYMPPSVEYIISVFSVLRCGEAFLPLDPSWPKDRILSIVSSSDCDLIITSESSCDKGSFNELNNLNWLVECSSCPVLCFSMEEALEECVGPLQITWPCEKREKRLFCYLLYTSGSTGKPKGVCGTEQGLLNRFLWMQELYPLHEQEVLLFKTSISFIDHLQEFLGAMLGACTLVIPPFTQLKKDPFSVVNFLQAYCINRLIAVPSLMRAILPALQSHQYKMQIQDSLKLLVLSGEVFPLSLWDVLSNLLPRTSILNLYGSTEVSGDCTYFDCKRLPQILETEALTSVPIGVPISNCDVVLVGETDPANQGEVCVGGLCVCTGYFSDSAMLSFDSVKVHKTLFCNCLVDDCGSQVYYRTGDFAQRLQCGDLVFLGRTDRSIKVHGQRIALEEIEITLREHPDVVDAAVISSEGPGGLLLLEAFLLLKDEEKSGDSVRSSIRSWMVGKVPLVMIPNRFVFRESLPISSSGKVDYALLATSAFFNVNVKDKICNTEISDHLHIIKKAFCDALMVEDVSDDDDFFMLGGSSITAAQVSYNLGIDMRLLYNFPTPSKLRNALLHERASYKDVRTEISWKSNLKAYSWNMSYSVNSSVPNTGLKKQKNFHQNNDHIVAVSKRFKVNLDNHISSKRVSLRGGYPWSSVIPISCSFSRCNKVMYEEECSLRNTHQLTWPAEVPRNRKGSSMQDLWKVQMESCVDASPLIVFKDQDVYLFIGSHSHKFTCVNAKSGSIQWEVKLEGRVECSAAIVADFSQVVVGCYKGKIYFLDFFNGNICWTFQTCAEVKCQPVVDIHRKLIWCGSHDQYLYALDYRNCCCIYKLSCGGSVFGSPAIDEMHETLYVASTSGRVTAVSIKALPFYTLWQHELQVPVFGSLSVDSSHGNVICCLVDGNIVALDLRGSIIWQHKTGGPVFAGACTSCVLPSQVLVCSRNGSVYSFEMEKGDLLWEYNVGDPITASAYVDEHLQLVSDSFLVSDRLVCVCTSSGSIRLLLINWDVAGKANQPSNNAVHELARFELPGDIFSSPVMIGGRIFVGCRDDYVHCIALENQSSVEE